MKDFYFDSRRCFFSPGCFSFSALKCFHIAPFSTFRPPVTLQIIILVMAPQSEVLQSSDGVGRVSTDMEPDHWMPRPDSMPRATMLIWVTLLWFLIPGTLVKLLTCCRELIHCRAGRPGGRAFGSWGNLWNMNVAAKFLPPSSFKPDHITHWVEHGPEVWNTISLNPLQSAQVKPVQVFYYFFYQCEQQNMRNGSSKWFQTKTAGQIMGFNFCIDSSLSQLYLVCKNETLHNYFDVYTQLSMIA